MLKDKKMLFAAWSCNNKNYFAYQTWYGPLRKIFNNVISFDPQEYTYRYEKGSMNQEFLKIVKHEKPDYIFLWLIYDEFYPETLFKIKEISPKTQVINFCGDDDAQFYDYSIYNSFFVDYSLITHKEFLKIYKNKAFFSVGTNTDQFRPLKIDKKYDVAFIGTPKTDRIEFAQYLMDKGIKIKIFGRGWENYPQFKGIYGGFLDKEDYTRVINETRINLCFNKNYQGATHVIQKFFEINACKAFVLTEYCKGYSDIFTEGKELVMFKNKEELLEKTKYYLKNEKEREAIAESAYTKILNKYSSDVELNSIFQEISGYKNIPKKNLPIIKEKVIYLSKEDLISATEILKEKIKLYDYISFKTEKSEILPYKDFFQVASLKIFKKDISCCDYYLYSSKLGEYLAVYANLAFKIMKKKDFSRVIKLDQLTITKSFLLNNLEEFREICRDKNVNFINEKNTAFVTRPLVRINTFPSIELEKLKGISWPKFENRIKTLFYQKDLRIFVYLYNSALAYFLGNKLILEYLSEKSKEKIKRSKEFFSLK